MEKNTIKKSKILETSSDNMGYRKSRRGTRQARIVDNMKDKINIPRPIQVAMTDQPRFLSFSHFVSSSAYTSAASVTPAKKLFKEKILIYEIFLRLDRAIRKTRS